MSSLPYSTEQTTLFQTKRTKLKKSITSWLHYNKTAIQKNSSKKTVKKHNRRKQQPRERPENEPKQTKSINLPYMQGVSEQLKQALSKHNISATFYTQTTLRNLLSKPKDPIPNEDKNNAVH